MAHSALTSLYSDDGFVNQGTPGASSIVTSPLRAAGRLGAAGNHLSLLGVVLFLLLMWGLVHKAGFRFIVTTGVG